MNEKGEVPNPTPAHSLDSSVRMLDVAQAAGVSRATVWNVLNSPHLVALGTRERVQSVVRAMSFEPDPTARALRSQGTAGPDHDTGGLRLGMHLLLQIGPETVSGIVDAVMPDGSCIWIWMDGGMGRRMIHRSEASDVRTTSNGGTSVLDFSHIQPMQ